MNSHQHARQTLSTWSAIHDVRKHGTVILNGNSLDIPGVVAVARYGCLPMLDEDADTSERIARCAEFLDSYLKKGYHVYGANTGFGGSADSRTQDFARLQSSLLQLTQSGILSGRQSYDVYQNDGQAHCMPTSWTRATTLVRVNSLARGHSAVRLETVKALLKLIEHHINPIIPLRGSISASGDLMPLAYIAGTLEGSPDIAVSLGQGPEAIVIPAIDAIKSIGLAPIALGPKEGLGILNGTALSAAVASLASHDSSQLALLSQLLVAMSCEALRGNADNWHPFMAKIRPHPGQIEVASNIRAFLTGSQLAVFASDRFRSGLFQDRYALRTSSQWIGPQLEDLELAAKQINIELNSTTDNPVIEVSSGDIISGGNFQAVSITTASEKMRNSLQMIGKLLSCLCTELINPVTNNGLPPNLSADDPSLSFTMKGVDINVAAYMSELAYLANPVSSHVQSAEMHNQAVNSLAFLTTRYTMEAVKLVKMISAAHLYVVCQALDLRVLHLAFLTQIQPVIHESVRQHFLVTDDNKLKSFPNMPLVASLWASSSTYDLSQRCESLAAGLVSALADLLASSSASANNDISSLQAWKHSVQSTCVETFTTLRKSFIACPTTPQYLSGASGAMYRFVREELGVPFHQGAVEHPKAASSDKNTLDGRDKKMVGSWISSIFEALNDGRMDALVARVVQRFVLDLDRVGGSTEDVVVVGTVEQQRQQQQQVKARL